MKIKIENYKGKKYSLFLDNFCITLANHRSTGNMSADSVSVKKIKAGKDDEKILKTWKYLLHFLEF